MNKKIYIPLGIIVIIIVSLSVYYFLQQRILSLDESVAIRPIVKERVDGDKEMDEVDLSDDLSELEEIADDSNLADLDSDLEMLSEDSDSQANVDETAGSAKPTVDVSDLEDIDQSLGSELDDLNATLNDLEGLGDDSSYSDLGTTLDDLLL